MTTMNTKYTCSFCGMELDVTSKLAIRSSVNEGLLMCADCIDDCHKAMLQYNVNKPMEETMENNFTPSQMKEFFDKYIIKQDDAKRTLSVAIYNHYKKVFYNTKVADNENDMKLNKSNILLIGPSGSGKTLFAKAISKKLGVPFAIADATTLTESGYVGDDTEMVLKKLIQNANGDISKAEKGIIFIDEIDKIARKGENRSITRDVSGEGVQQSLLKMLEGNNISVPVTGNRKHPNQECYQIDTTNILFICGGAFEDLDKIIEKRMNKKTKIGFNTKDKEFIKKKNSEELVKEVTTEDLIKFGLMPEFLGRLPVVSTLESLDRDALVEILTKPVDSIINQYTALMNMDGIEIEFSQEYLEGVADLAIKKGTGARALQSILEKNLNPYMYEIPDLAVNKVVLTKECIEGTGVPEYSFIDQKGA